LTWDVTKLIISINLSIAPTPSANEGGTIYGFRVSRRNFLTQLGMTAGTVAAATAAPFVGGPSLIGRAEAQAQPKGKIPDTPYKVGHMTFHTGAAAVLGEPMYKGHILAAEEINAKGGLLGKRKIETVKADENAGTDANVKELRRMKLREIDFFTGITSATRRP
jgi:branched-chain amino acid transport system substrate-binding protein